MTGIRTFGVWHWRCTDRRRREKSCGRPIDKVLRILDDPALKGEAKTRERRAALRGVMEGAIDFPEAARRALAVHLADANRGRAGGVRL